MKDDHIGIKEAMVILAKTAPIKRRPTITAFCKDGSIPAVMRGRCWYIRRDYIEKAKEWRDSVRTLSELLEGNAEYAGLSDEDKKNCMRAILYKGEDLLIRSHEYAKVFTGPFVSLEDEKNVTGIIAASVKNYTRNDLVPIAEAAEQTGYSPYVLKNMIKGGSVKAVTINHNWFFEPDEITDIIDRRNRYIPLLRIAEEICERTPSAFDPENLDHRLRLRVYAKKTPIAPFLVPESALKLYQDRKYTYYVPLRLREKAVDVLTPYIRHYGMSEERIRKLSEHEYWKMNPLTLAAVDVFCQTKNDVAKAALMEIIAATLNCEIMKAEEADIDRMIDYAEGSLSQIYGEILGSFLVFIQKEHDCNFGTRLRKRKDLQKKQVTITPYPLDDYCMLAYMTFNDDFIRKNGLVSKALSDPRQAYVWLRTAFFFIGMLRDTDIRKNIPVIYPGCSAEALKKQIQNGTFSEKDADRLSMLLEAAVLAEGEAPSKTKKGKLRIHIAESLRTVIGLIYACNLVHATGDHIKGFSAGIKDHQKFFGQSYIDTFGFQTISSRRVNKSYADMIMEITDRRTGQEHKVRGYMVAAYARSHVMKDGKLPEVTSRYLQYKMDGYTSDEIMMQLWELGVCSFTVNMFLETVYGEAYKKLPFMAQTELVKESGLDAYAVEIVTARLQHAYRVGEKLVGSVFAHYPGSAGIVVFSDAMTNILDGYAPAKDEGMYCLQLAFGGQCVLQGCGHCLGCEYVIVTRAALYTAFQILKDAFSKMRSAVTKTTREMYKALIEQKYLPGILEILETAKQEYGMDTNDYKYRVLMLMDGKEDPDDKSV